MFSKLILLYFISTIDNFGLINAAVTKTGNNSEVGIENLLIKFMTDLKKFILDELDSSHFTILGKNNILLETTKVLIKNTPYFIGNEAKAAVLSSHSSRDSVVIFFVDGLINSQVETNIGKLPNDYSCRVLLISLKENATHEAIAKTIASATKIKIRNVSFAHFDGQAIKIYRQSPKADCRSDISLINEWTPKTGFKINETFLKRHNARRVDNHGCPLVVSALESTPTLILQKDKNESLQIRGGIEGRLVIIIAEHLNMVPVIRAAPEREQGWLAPNGSIIGIVGDVAREDTSLGIGQITPTLERYKIVDFTASYNHECIVWTVPFSTEYNYNIVTSEFSSTMWMLVILSLFLCCGTAHLISKVNRVNIHSRWSSLNIFDVIAVSLRYAIPPRSLLHSMLGKLFFLLYLYYSLLVSTAYTISLSSIMTTSVPQPKIVDENGILVSGLRTAGSQSIRRMLSYQITANSTRAELINRFEVITSSKIALARIADRRDIAYLRQRSTIRHVAAEILMAGSQLTDTISMIVLRLCETGIYKYWMSIDRVSEFEMTKLTYNNHTLARLKSVFLVYLSCLVPAFFAFVAELIISKL